MKLKKIADALSLELFGILFFFTTVIGCGLWLRWLRDQTNRATYWGMQGLAVAALWYFASPLAVLSFLSVTVLIGTHYELEGYGFDLFSSGAIAVLISFVMGLASFCWYARSWEAPWTAELARKTEESFTEMGLNYSAATRNIKVEDVINRLPAISMILLALSLWIALIWTQGHARAESSRWHRLQMLRFRLPDWSVWILIAILIGAFYKHSWVEARWMASNAIIVLVFLYFLQGLAVVATWFSYYKIGFAWRLVAYVFIVGNVALMVSLLGLADYWFMFRERLKKKPGSS